MNMSRKRSTASKMLRKCGPAGGYCNGERWDRVWCDENAEEALHGVESVEELCNVGSVEEAWSGTRFFVLKVVF